MFRIVGKVKGGDMKERWYSGIFLGKRAGSDENLVMTQDGNVVRARAIKETHCALRLQDLDSLRGSLHDLAGILRGEVRDDGRDAHLEEDARSDVGGGPTPKRAQITKEVVNRFGATPGCMSSRGVIAGDRSYQYVHHNDTCRVRMEAFMRQDDKFSKLIEAAEERQTRRIAEMLERKDKEHAERAAREEAKIKQEKKKEDQKDKADT